ncbi:ornithine carbamoyltransferase [Pararhodospirillum oryzae]|uniref:Ornithine carbamoyltransferase n=1 Tax=Pararhodospirillum oryzae TaxID=478448 RepID=A0A512H4F2_9PROT|nr:ornithine carbamoyltransferase [Pararhodospirillum oryzae]GEO80313.1 ornithine carbamoyltransferase [Pararhodospirillum oryzae]
MARARPIRHFLDLADIDPATLRGIVDQGAAFKAARHAGTPETPVLAGKTLALIFQRNSTRTRVSFEVGMRQLGGDVLVLTGDTLQLSRGETIADTARVLSRYVDAIMLRTDSHDDLDELAAHASVPVINGLTNLAHPCQILADIMTVEEHRGPIAGKVVAWVGDGNNVSCSWIKAAARFGFSIRVACPAEFAPPDDVVAWTRANGGDVTVTDDPAAAAAGADCVVTDTWMSMSVGEAEREMRTRLLHPYQVNRPLMALAHSEALFLHCLPAHRGEEVTADVIDGPQSVVWDEAENRLHAQKAILAWCLT